MKPDEVFAELERTDTGISSQDNRPVSQACTECPTHVTKVSGPDETCLGKIYTFQVDEYGCEIQGDYWPEKVSWEISLYREPEIWRPDRRQIVAKTVLANHGGKLTLEIKEYLAFLDMQIFAYITTLVDNVSIKPKIRGAWAVTGIWSTQKITEYRAYTKTATDAYFRSNVRMFVCEDFATTLVVQFAQTNNLPFKISNETVLYDDKEYHYSEQDNDEKHIPFDQVILKTTGVQNLNSGNQSNTITVVYNIIAFPYSITLQGKLVKSGMLHIMDASNSGITNHIQVIINVNMQMTPPYVNQSLTVRISLYLGKFIVAKIEVHQGNYP